jgi:hypothetical protein
VIGIGIQYLGDLFSQYQSWENALRHFYSGNSKNKSREVSRYVKAVLAKAKHFEQSLGHL